MMNKRRESPSPSASPDTLIRLRQWGTDIAYPLPSLTFDQCGEWSIGRSGECAVQLSAPSVAAKQAHLTFDGLQWWVSDYGSSHGMLQDGVPRQRFALSPGTEIGVGPITLIAESARTIRLRQFAQRLLGWGDDRMRAVDHFLRAIRLVSAHRAPLTLCGEGDLVPIARGLHQYAYGAGAPFIVCDRHRRQGEARLHSPTNVPSAMEAFVAATGGSLCIRYHRLPKHLDHIMGRVYDPESDVRLFVCMDRRLYVHRQMTPPIQIPPLQLRAMELPRIVNEYAQDAIARLDVDASCFGEKEQSWVIRHCAQSLHEIEKATLRVIALRTTNNITQAADRLGLANVSLVNWLHRRPLIGNEREFPPIHRPRRTLAPQSSLSSAEVA